jgi:8-oxo-dGTP pyrophosphatase MutT (NUDIX family)
MDLTITIENTILNIRVAVIMQTKRGYLIEKNKKGYYHFIGGRVKAGENSLQAAKRETQEETGLEIDNFEFVSLLENFFTDVDGAKVHEICFVYKTENVEHIDPKFGLEEFTKEEIRDKDIRPEHIKRMILENGLEKVTHHIV